ncbi:hypothetical protein H1Q59_00225 [Holosporaceae bacterium 'Namur']|nr:hypothetical protein [Holosporaceae bacterium 'Namur']
MISGINLFAINEDKSETKYANPSYTNKLNNYSSNNLYNPINAFSIYIRAFEYVGNTCKSVGNELKEIKRVAADKIGNQKQSLAQRRFEVYNRIDKSLKIIMEFRKVFSLSEAHELRVHLKDIDERLAFIYDSIILANATSKEKYFEEAGSVTNYLIQFFIAMQKNMHDSVHAANLESIEQSKVGNLIS